MFKRLVIILFILVSAFVIAPQANAQCSMCTINAEQGTQNGNTQAKGINDGVIYLLLFPYLLLTVGGILWYKSYRRKIEQDKISA